MNNPSIKRLQLNEIVSFGRTDCGAKTEDRPERASVLTLTATLPLDSEEPDHLPPLAVKLTAVEVPSPNWKLKASGITWLLSADASRLPCPFIRTRNFGCRLSVTRTPCPLITAKW